MISQERLKELLHYDPLTGIFSWIKPRSNRAQIGDRAGNIMKSSSCKPYRRIGLDYKTYTEHRLAWLYMYGKLPTEQLDHENQNCQDNKIQNLRLVSQIQNSQNQKMQSNNLSGFTGVCWTPSRKQWQAYIQVNKKNKNLGWFKTKQEAISARQQANIKHGFHKNHGKHHV